MTVIAGPFVYRGHAATVNEWKQPRRPRGMILTATYRAFLEFLMVRLSKQWNKQPLTQKVDVVIAIQFPGCDSDAMTKPIFDGLEHAGILKSDKQICNHMILRLPGKAKAHTCRFMLWILDTSPGFGLPSIQTHFLEGDK